MPNDLISCDDHPRPGPTSPRPPDPPACRPPSATRPVIEERNGQALWICDNKVWGNWAGMKRDAVSLAAPKPLYTALDRGGMNDPSERRPAHAKLRLQDMDRDGVQSHVIFGPIFSITTEDTVSATPATAPITTSWGNFARRPTA